jgi:hypothetical protein
MKTKRKDYYFKNDELAALYRDDEYDADVMNEGSCAKAINFGRWAGGTPYLMLPSFTRLADCCGHAYAEAVRNAVGALNALAEATAGIERVLSQVPSCPVRGQGKEQLEARLGVTAAAMKDMWGELATLCGLREDNAEDVGNI